nr:reverse transcriptase domain-containing protein [Tanacetum cinerariifolium]
MRIFGFMHGINNPELTKRLNEHVPKTMEEMMIATTAFIRGEAVAASKKKGHINETEGPLVIEAEIGRHTIHRMYIDGGSSMEILYEHCFNRLRPDIKNQMVPATTSLTGFGGETTWPLGQLRLLVTIGDVTHSTKAWMNFMIVKSLSPYNGIIGRSRLKVIQAVPSTVHGMLKFPTEEGIVTIRSSLLIPAECASVDTSSVTPREKKTRPTNLTVTLHPNFPDQEVVVGGSLSDKGRTELCSLLKKNLDIFAWKPKEGLPPNTTGSSRRRKDSFSHRTGVYYYTKMPFGLKNSGATYQRLMDKAFESQMGRNIEVYVDDLVVKSHTEAEIVRDIEETFQTLRKINMKLNPKKCSFVLAEGVFLGYVITPEGINPCPDKTTAVLQLPSPQTIKEVQSLNGKLASLNRFLSKSAEKSLPLFQTLKKCIKNSDFRWTAKAEQVFQQLKQHFSDLPLLAAPKPQEELIMYLSATHGAFSAVLMTERGTAQTPVYFISRALQEYVMREIHEGSCSMHAGPRSVVAKAIRLGYFWPTMHKDAQDMIHKCSDCQIHRPVTRHPQQPLTPITAPWPFYKWGIDIAGPFPEGPGKVKFLIVAMDYFTKWIEAKAVATIIGGQVKKFVWDNIVCRFGIPGEIISDKGKQFADNPFKDWCEKLNITQRFASVKHLQSNGLVERANRSLGEGIKARLGEGNKNWVEELPHVLWAHRTMIKSRHGDTPFSLTYGTETVIPAEIEMPTYRTTAVDVVNNDEELRDFVYHSNDASHAVAGGKLGPKWEGPYEVTDALGNGAYKLRSTDGTVLPKTWNVTNLKRCYL